MWGVKEWLRVLVHFNEVEGGVRTHLIIKHLDGSLKALVVQANKPKDRVRQPLGGAHNVAQRRYGVFA